MDFDKYFFDDEQSDNYQQGKRTQGREYHEENKEYLSSRSDNCWQDNPRNDSQSCRWKDAGNTQKQGSNMQRPTPGTTTSVNTCKSASDSYRGSDKPSLENRNDSYLENNFHGNNNVNSCNKKSNCEGNMYSDDYIYQAEDIYSEDDIYNDEEMYYENDSYSEDAYCGCEDDSSGGNGDDSDCDDDIGDNGNCGEDFCDDDCCFDECQIGNQCPCGECNRYLQNKMGSYFHGQGEILPFCLGKRAYYIIKNPDISDVDVSLARFTFANFGPTPMRVNISYCATMTGNLAQSNNIVTGNSNNCSGIDSTAKIYFGNKKKMSDGMPAQTICVPAFTTISNEVEGSSILAPGFSCMVEIMGVTEKDQGYGITSFEWWESPIVLLE